MVELKARFDEEANINWAERLEAVGAQVVYGVVGLKTHAKLLLVTRREDGAAAPLRAPVDRQLQPEARARLYTDLGYLTADPDLTADADAVFQQLASLGRTQAAAAPAAGAVHAAQAACSRSIDAGRRRGARRAAGAHRRQDQRADRRAADRGAGRRRPGRRRHRPDRARRLHAAAGHRRASPTASACARWSAASSSTRASSTSAGATAADDEALYLSSADWMGRNMFGRIEVAWPVRDAALRQRVIDECLVPYLHDAQRRVGAARRRQLRARRAATAESAQQALMQRCASGPVERLMDLILWRHAEAVAKRDGRRRPRRAR